LAALQVRWRCSVVAGVDGRVRPGEALMSFASKLKLPITENALICWSFVALAGWSFAAWIVVPRDGRRNPEAGATTRTE
jgi:hypothetical protein